MHRVFVEQLLEEEVARARADDLLRPRINQIERRGRSVYVSAQNAQGTLLLRLDGANYDAEPLQLMALDPKTEIELPGAAWPAGLYFGSDHPSLGRPWTCSVGTYEYHLHTSHLSDSWDQRRRTYDLPTLLRQLLTKAGA